MSPLYPSAWDEIQAPAITVEPPGPLSREILARISATAYPGLANHLAPLVVAEKRAWTVADVDGNVYLDCASASASLPNVRRASTAGSSSSRRPAPSGTEAEAEAQSR